MLNEAITADEAFTCVSQPYWSQTTFPSNMNTKCKPAGFLQKRLRGLNLIGSSGVTPCINKSMSTSSNVASSNTGELELEDSYNYR